MTKPNLAPATGTSPAPVSADVAERASLAPCARGHEPAMPPAPPVNYLTAARAMLALTRDKENTRHVFDVVRAVNGTSPKRGFDRFCASPLGQATIEDPHRLLRVMDDRAALLNLPENTFGHAYARFMEREGLSTNGVHEASVAVADDYETFVADYPWLATYHWHMNLTHDLYHILTGYGRDALGEGAVLRFTFEHSHTDGIRFIARFAGLRVRLEDFGIPAGAVLREAGRLGREATGFVTTDWVSLFERPLDEVRRRLNVGTPRRYLAIAPERLAKIGATAQTPQHGQAHAA